MSAAAGDGTADAAPSGLEPSGLEPSGLEPSGLEPSGPEQSGLEPSGLEPSGLEPSGPEQSGPEPSGLEPSGPAPTDLPSSGLALSGNSPACIHATTVAFGPDLGVIILGASGTGKSALALQLMALGAQLVADDRTLLMRHGDALTASAPAPLIGLIEAWGIGLIRVQPLEQAALVLAIDMDQPATTRMPPLQSRSWLGIALPLLHKVEGGHFPAAILHYIGSVNRDPP